MLRTFIAIKIPAVEELKNLIARFRSVMKEESIKWVDPENLHITLRFLGDTADDMIKPIHESLNNAANKCSGFDLVLKGTGVFKNFHDPRVIWIGTEELFGNLLQLKNETDAERGADIF